jgi:NADH:ubiquinone oxidoreductase subunit 5 (subunit L)/multisubunit Na+/H+ antiporter MnhA subunit
MEIGFIRDFPIMYNTIDIDLGNGNIITKPIEPLDTKFINKKCLSTIQKGETHLIASWIHYHRSLGFEAFIIYDNSFNINNYNVSDIEFIDPIYKLIPLLAVTKGIVFSFCLYIKNKQQFFEQKQSNFFKSIYSFLLKKWYTDRLVNEVVSASLLTFAKKYPYNSLDRGLLEVLGPTAISRGTNNVLYSSTDVIKFGGNFFK